MFMYTLFTVALVGSAYFWFNGTFSTLYENVLQVKNKINGMKVIIKRNPINGKERNINFKTLLNMVKFALVLTGKILYLRFYQFLNNTVEQINRNKFIFKYSINGKMFKIPVTIKRGPCPIIYVHNENNIDVTDDLLQFAGPAYDFHKQELTPLFFNSKTLYIEFANGTFSQFDENQAIIINP